MKLRRQPLLQCGHGLKAVENRGAGVGHHEGAPAASMRPRPESRGELVPPLTATILARTLLQCGHGLKAVENLVSPLQFWHHHLLQCGHGLKAVENPRYGVEHYQGGRASMRPRPESR